MPATSQWFFDPYRLDLDNALLWQGERTIALRPKTFEVLVYLVEHAGQLVSKEAILETVWADTAVSESVLKGCIGEIRKTLQDSVTTPRFIATMHRRGYRFIAPVTAVSPVTAEPAQAVPSPLPPSSSPPKRTTSHAPLSAAHASILVSREAELTLLHQWLATVLRGECWIGFISGEAGIGKTALVDAFVTQIEDRSGLWIGRGQCVEQYGAGEAYLPLLEAFGQLARSPGGARIIEILHQYAPSWLQQMPALLSASEFDLLQQQHRGVTRERMLRELTGAVEALTAERPLVLVLEDLHWSDVSTLDWLTYMARRRASARLLVLGTYRPVDAIVQAHPLRKVTQELRLLNACEDLSLGYLSEAGIASYLNQRFGELPMQDRLARVLYQRTNGNPFFMVNVVEDALWQGVLREDSTGWALPGGIEGFESGVPESLRQLIEQQFGHLEPDEQELLEAASVVGMEFSTAAVAAGVRRSVEEVESRCNVLARRSQFVQTRGTTTWPDGTMVETYEFVHALYQESLYDRVPASRRVRWHREIGLRQEVGYDAQARAMAAELAVHFVRGREPRRAVQYLRHAAYNATRRHAYQEAIDHLAIGLDMLVTLPDTPERLQHELAMQTSLGTALVAATGPSSSEVEQAYSRAYTLSQQVEDVEQQFSILRGLWNCYFIRAELETARGFAEQLLVLAQQLGDPALLLEAHRSLGITLLFRGELTVAREHLEAGMTLYRPQQHRELSVRHGADPGVIGQLHIASANWRLGYADRARQLLDTALSLAREQDHPYSLAHALCLGATLLQRWHMDALTPERVEAALTVASDYGFPYLVIWGHALQGWLDVEQGRVDAGIEQLQGALDAWRDMGTERARPWWLFVLAGAYGKAGQTAEGITALAEALDHIDKTGERFCEPEIFRLKGELLLQQAVPDLPQAEACFQQALAVARHQQAKALELRSAMNLSRLWQHQGHRDAARHLLAEVYGWFTEGFDTCDLQEAKALLEQLRA